MVVRARSPFDKLRVSGSKLDGDDVGFPHHAQLSPDPLLDGLANVRVVPEKLLRVLAALAQTLAAISKPRARFFDDAFVDCEVDQITGAGDAFAVHDVEFGFAEGRRHFVFHDLHAGAAADHDIAVLDAGDAANIHPHGGVELQRA